MFCPKCVISAPFASFLLSVMQRVSFRCVAVLDAGVNPSLVREARHMDIRKKPPDDRWQRELT